MFSVDNSSSQTKRLHQRNLYVTNVTIFKDKNILWEGTFVSGTVWWTGHWPGRGDWPTGRPFCGPATRYYATHYNGCLFYRPCNIHSTGRPFVGVPLYSTLYSLHYTLHSQPLHSRLHTIPSTFHTSHIFPHTLHLSLNTKHFTLPTIHLIFYSYSM